MRVRTIWEASLVNRESCDADVWVTDIAFGCHIMDWEERARILARYEIWKAGRKQTKQITDLWAAQP